jgi:hypothetical protein
MPLSFTPLACEDGEDTKIFSWTVYALEKLYINILPYLPA